MIKAGSNRDSVLVLHAFLGALMRAERVQYGGQLAIRLAIVALFSDVIVVLAARLLSISTTTGWLLGPPMLTLVAAALVTALRRPDLRAIARRADRSLSLQERILTAVELDGRGQDVPFLHEQLADTLFRVRGREPGDAFPLRFSRGDIALLSLALVALSAALALTASPGVADADRAVAKAAIEREAERVSAVADEVERGATPDNPATRLAIARPLRDAAKTLRDQSSSPEKAVAALAAAEQELSRMLDGSADAQRQAMSQMAEGLRREAITREAGVQLAKGEAAAAASALRDLAKDSSRMSSTQLAAAAQALRRAGDEVGRSSPSLGEGLRNAAQALGSGAPQAQAQAALDQAANDLQASGDALARQDIVEKALSELASGRARIGGSSGRGESQPRQGTAQRVGPSGGDRRANDAQEPSARGESGGRGSGASGGDQRGEGEAEGGGEPGDRGGGGAGSGSAQRAGEVFAPNAVTGQEEQIAANGFDRPSMSASPASHVADNGQSTVDYREVYATYRDQATAAVQDRYIPLDLKDLVKEYFSSLDPERQ